MSQINLVNDPSIISFIDPSKYAEFTNYVCQNLTLDDLIILHNSGKAVFSSRTFDIMILNDKIHKIQWYFENISDESFYPFIRICCKYGKLDTMKWIFTKINNLRSRLTNFGELNIGMQLAIKNQHLHIVEWLHETKKVKKYIPEILPELFVDCNLDLFVYVTMNQHPKFNLETLEKARDNCMETKNIRFMTYLMNHWDDLLMN